MLSALTVSTQLGNPNEFQPALEIKGKRALPKGGMLQSTSLPHVALSVKKCLIILFEYGPALSYLTGFLKVQYYI